MTRVRKFAVLLICAVLACASPQAEPESPGQSMSLDDLREHVLEVRGDGACSATSECRAVPFGAKPCGGPWSYLVYSTAATDSARLVNLVAEYNRREAERNETAGRMSDCMFVEPPVLQCTDGRCGTR